MSESAARTERSSVTLDDLKRLQEQKLAELGLEPPKAAGGAADSGVEPLKAETVGAICTLCEKPFSYTPIRVGGLKIGHRNACPACAEAEEKRKAEEQARAEADQARRKNEGRTSRLPELLEDIGVSPWEHGTARFESFEASESGMEPVQAAQQFLDDVRGAEKYTAVRGLYLHGPTGAGKSHLAVSVLRELILDVKRPLGGLMFDRAEELVLRIQDTYGTSASTFDVLEKRYEADVWVLDDLGTERASDDVARHLTLVFARRAFRPTIVTSNLSPEDLERSRPELLRVLSRLGPAYFRVVPVTGRDRRFD